MARLKFRIAYEIIWIVDILPWAFCDHNVASGLAISDVLHLLEWAVLAWLHHLAFLCGVLSLFDLSIELAEAFFAELILGGDLFAEGPVEAEVANAMLFFDPVFWALAADLRATVSTR